MFFNKIDVSCKTVLDVSPNPVVIYDVHGYPEYVNPAFVTLFGWMLDELRGRHIPFVPDDQREMTFQKVREVAEQHVTITFETSRLTKAGERLDFIVGATELRAPEGTVLGQIVTYTNVTPLKCAERELRERESWLNAVFLASPVPIVVYDTDGNARYVNPAFVSLFGWTLEELQGRRIPFVPDDQRQISAAVIADLYAREEPVTLETKRLKRDGSLADVLIRAALIKSPGGTAEGMVVTLTDTTIFKRVEAELEKSRARLEAIFAASPVPLILYDIHGCPLYLNASFEKLFGWTLGELAGKIIPFVPDDQKEQTFSVIRGLYDHGLPVVTLETQRYKKTGETIDVIVSAALVRGSEGAPEGMVVAITDITDRKQVERERLEMERRFLQSQKRESLGMLAGGIAHDFNNLLTAVLGNIEMARLVIPADSRAQGNLEAAEKGGQRAAALTRQMLDYSGRGSLVKQSTDINDLVTEMTQILKSSFSKNISLSFRLEHGLPPVDADPSQVQQVVMNLIVNAAEAIERGEGAISIVTGWNHFDAAYLSQSHMHEKPEPGRYVFIEVSDTGCGMDNETQQKLFDPFYTTKFAGRGLGLSAVHGIVKGHGGAIIVRSRPGAGSTFTVLFPVGKAVPVPGKLEAADYSAAETKQIVADKILIVDDEDLVREICASLLESLGFVTLSACDGKQALAIYREQASSISCVIVDLTMPGIDGFELIDLLREISPGVRVILATGYSTTDIGATVRQKGFSALVQKPFSLGDLKKAISDTLGMV